MFRLTPVSRSALRAPTTGTLSRSFVTTLPRGNATASSSSHDTSDTALLVRIKQELKNAMRSKDAVAAGSLRALLSAHQYALKSSSSSAPPSLATLIQRQVSKHRDCASIFRSSNPPREDLAVKEEQEASIVSSLLPPELSREELDAAVKAKVEELKAADEGKEVRMGDVIKAVAAQVGPSASAKSIAAAVRDALGGAGKGK